VTGGIAKCTQADTKKNIGDVTTTGDVKVNYRSATFDFVFSEAALTKVTVNAVGKGVQVGDVFKFTAAQLGYAKDTTGPTGEYWLTVTADMLVGVFGPHEDLSFTLTEADLECQIPHGDANALLPLGSATAARVSTAAYVPAAADYQAQKITFTLLNPKGYAGAKKVTLTVGNSKSSSIPQLSSTSSTTHFSGEPSFENLHILDDKSSATVSQQANRARLVTISFDVNLHGAGDIDAGTTFTIDGLLSTTASNAALPLAGASKDLFTAALTQSCNPTKTTLVLTAKSLIKAGNAKFSVVVALEAVAYGRAGSAVMISADSLNTAAPTHTISKTAFPAEETKYVLATSLSNVEAVSPVRVAQGYTQAEVTGLQPGNDVGFVKSAGGDEPNLCNTLVLNSGGSATQSNGVNVNGLDTSAKLDIAGLGAGMYKTCIVRGSDGCGKDGDFKTAAQSAATLTVVKPTLSPLTAVQSTATQFNLGPTALVGDFIRFSTIGCQDTKGSTVALTANGVVTGPASLVAGTPVYVCYATKEAPVHMIALGAVTVYKESLVVTLKLVIKDANGKELTATGYINKMSTADRAKFDSVLIATVAGQIGVAAANVQIVGYSDGPVVVNMRITGTDAELQKAKTELAKPSVDAAIAKAAADELSALDPTSTFSATATSDGGKISGTTPPVTPTTGTTTGSTTGTTTGKPVLTAGANITPTVVLGAIMAMLSMALLKW
jgi:hypothetical protein